MIKCVIHCSDVHIRLFQRLEEYTEQLNAFVSKCEEIASGYEKDEVRIVIAGDLGHSKNQLTPEFITLTSFFLRQLEKIAKVIVIAGNHDLLVNNTSRIDAITAIFETANFENVAFLDSMLGYESGIIEDDNIVWAVYSIYNGYSAPDLSGVEEGKTIVGLYHGMVVGATLNNGTVAESGVNGNLFEGCDLVMAGDIHKRQVLKRGDVEIIYPGSLIQQTFGETVSQHGFAVWDIESKTYEFSDLETDYGLYDIQVSTIDDFDDDKERLINF